MIWTWVFLYRIDIVTRALRRGLRNVLNPMLVCAAKWCRGENVMELCA